MSKGPCYSKHELNTLSNHQQESNEKTTSSMTDNGNVGVQHVFHIDGLREQIFDFSLMKDITLNELTNLSHVDRTFSKYYSQFDVIKRNAILPNCETALGVIFFQHPKKKSDCMWGISPWDFKPHKKCLISIFSAAEKTRRVMNRQNRFCIILDDYNQEESHHELRKEDSMKKQLQGFLKVIEIRNFFFTAVRHNLLEITEYLLQQTNIINVHQQGPKIVKSDAKQIDDYAVKAASYDGHLRIVQLLVKHGADIFDTHPDPDHHNKIHPYINEKYPEFKFSIFSSIKWKFKGKLAKLYSKKPKHKDALIYAALGGHFPVIEFLLETAEKNKNPYGRVSLILAKQLTHRNRNDIIELLDGYIAIAKTPYAGSKWSYSIT